MTTKVNPQVQQLQNMVQNEIANIHTSCPGTILSFDGRFATVKPFLQYKSEDGRIVDYPVISNVLVQFPASNGGQCSVTFPIKSGDQVTLLFAERSLDDFLSGGVSEDNRKYDLTDAVAIPGLFNSGVPAAQKYSNDVCITNGNATIRLTPSGEIILQGQKLTMNTTDGSTINGGDLTVNGVSVTKHVHGGVEPGGGSTGQPVGGG